MTTKDHPNYTTTFATGGLLVRALAGCHMNANELLCHGLDMDEMPFGSIDAPEWIPAGSCKAVDETWVGHYTMTVCNPRD